MNVEELIENAPSVSRRARRLERMQWALDPAQPHGTTGQRVLQKILNRSRTASEVAGDLGLSVSYVRGFLSCATIKRVKGAPPGHERHRYTLQGSDLDDLQQAISTLPQSDVSRLRQVFGFDPPVDFVSSTDTATAAEREFYAKRQMTGTAALIRFLEEEPAAVAVASRLYFVRRLTRKRLYQTLRVNGLKRKQRAWALGLVNRLVELGPAMEVNKWWELNKVCRLMLPMALPMLSSKILKHMQVEEQEILETIVR